MHSVNIFIESSQKKNINNMRAYIFESSQKKIMIIMNSIESTQKKNNA